MFNEEKQCVYEEIDRYVLRYDDLKTTTGIFLWFLWALNSAEGLALGGSRVIDVYGIRLGQYNTAPSNEVDWRANPAVVHGISKLESTCPFMSSYLERARTASERWELFALRCNRTVRCD
ncbi:uncharacterized protein ARMOST_19012 [Armillaria ostoyae]|uniref:Uncharacterized protein n=1 Tax=Armillaria ostoyae TaxID=47428 RepID=A0A284S3B9_ARMOS|nr:uncharacterized protein ARMOST_19012 [Armillaria ostoyae]